MDRVPTYSETPTPRMLGFENIRPRTTRGFAAVWRIFAPMDFKRDQLETRVATIELMLVTERARPKPDEHEIEKLEKELREAKSSLQKYMDEHP